MLFRSRASPSFPSAPAAPAAPTLPSTPGLPSAPAATRVQCRRVTHNPSTPRQTNEQESVTVFSGRTDLAVHAWLAVRAWRPCGTCSDASVTNVVCCARQPLEATQHKQPNVQQERHRLFRPVRLSHRCRACRRRLQPQAVADPTQHCQRSSHEGAKAPSFPAGPAGPAFPSAPSLPFAPGFPAAPAPTSTVGLATCACVRACEHVCLLRSPTSGSRRSPAVVHDANATRHKISHT